MRQIQQGISYQGRQAREQEDSLFYHLAKRVVDDAQWAPGTTAEQYLADLRQAVRSPSAQLAAYRDRGGTIVAAISSTAAILPPARQEARARSNLLVIYPAARGIIVIGYQFSTLAATRVSQEALWLK